MKDRLLFEDRLPALTMEDACCILEALGPMPADVLVAMVDYGLNDTEIGRYYNLPQDMITKLREYWGIDGTP